MSNIEHEFFIERISLQTSLEERLSKNQNLLTSLRSSMGEKVLKISSRISIQSMNGFFFLGCKNQTFGTRFNHVSTNTTTATNSTSYGYQSSVSYANKTNSFYSTTAIGFYYSTNKNESTVNWMFRENVQEMEY